MVESVDNCKCHGKVQKLSKYAD